MDEQAALAVFDRELPGGAAETVRACCASDRWIAFIVDSRPYATLDAVLRASDAAIAGLQWADIEQALSAHPRIGQRATGADQESAWSRQEQAAAAAPADTAQALREGNAEYEERFGHVFLICATGRSAESVLENLRARMNNSVETEHEIVREELRQIVQLRLGKVFG
jgi:2-oxo-4-hydroxy-4-carboxy-5-ureidoimidazoline decarboxylase